MQNVDKMYELSNPVYLENKKIYITNLSSAELVQRVVKAKLIHIS